MGIVKFVVPRIDQGYRAALEQTNTHALALAASQVKIGENLDRIARNLDSQALLLDGMVHVAEKIADRSLEHQTSAAVHRERVDLMLSDIRDKK